MSLDVRKLEGELMVEAFWRYIDPDDAGLRGMLSGTVEALLIQALAYGFATGYAMAHSEQDDGLWRKS